MVSVIIPVYNAEKYLARCLDSLLAQTYSDFEIILINDGSSDKSLAICKEYAQKDSRVQARHQENQGVSAARNAGLDAASGQYIAFVDADDYVMPDYLERLLNKAEEYQADIICCDFVEILDEGLSSPYVPRVLRDRLVPDNATLFSDIIDTKEGYPACVWGKLIRADLAKRVRFQSLRFGEDHLYMFDLFACRPTVYLTTYQGYCYAPNENSVTVQYSAVSPTRLADEMHMHKYKAEHLPQSAQSLHDHFFNNYAYSLLAFISAICKNHYPSNEMHLARQEVKYILTGSTKVAAGIRLRLKLFYYFPLLYGCLIHLMGK